MTEKIPNIELQKDSQDKGYTKQSDFNKSVRTANNNKNHSG
jgi:hypothetical protein